MQLSKILTTTADAAIAPYKASPTPHPDTLKHIALCNRLIQFRQPIAIGIERYRSDNGKQLDGEAKINMKFFSQRGCISDEGIQQVCITFLQAYLKVVALIFVNLFDSIFESCFRRKEPLLTIEWESRLR